MLSNSTNIITCDHIINPFPDDNDFTSPKLQHYPPYNTFAFPSSPYDHDLHFLDLLYQHEESMMIMTSPDTDTATATATASATTPDGENHHVVPEGNNQPVIPTTTVMMRSSVCSKKDRHSKIETARGPRDRRMRLSLDVARKFFGLQDLLGFDKASRTVEWLLGNSSSAIRDLRSCSLTANTTTTSSSSTDRDDSCDQVVSSSKPQQPSSSCTKTKKKKRIKERRPRGPATVPTESRRKARERARERTSQKRLGLITTEFSHQVIKLQRL